MAAGALNDDARNKRLYEDPQTAKHYGEREGLLPGEAEAFTRYIAPNARVLDLGVGGGRTTAYLSTQAKQYVGIDYAKAMIAECRKRFPTLDLRVADASDLSDFDDQSFDAVVFSFNGLDYLHPYEKRTRCLAECRRVLTRGGYLIFSTHNAKCLAFLPDLDVSGVARKAWRAVYAGYRSAGLALRMPRTRSFWSGHGYLIDPVHGGLVTFQAAPSFVATELETAGLRHVTTIPTSPFATALPFVQRWYYYVAAKDD